MTCDCSKSRFCDENMKHIITGNLDIITNKKLRKLMTYGPNYRTPNRINWDWVYEEVDKSIKDCVQLLHEWKSNVLDKVQAKIGKLKRYNNHTKLDNDMRDILKDKHVCFFRRFT